MKTGGDEVSQNPKTIFFKSGKKCIYDLNFVRHLNLSAEPFGVISNHNLGENAGCHGNPVRNHTLFIKVPVRKILNQD